MRWRFPKYYPGWFVSGGGGSGGSGTVQTDGVTIQGDGSAGNKIAIKAVQTDATLTGAGTVASPLSAAQQTPTGWPIPFFSFGAISSATQRSFATTINTLCVYGLAIPAQVQFSSIGCLIAVSDAGGLYDLGIYSAAGTRLAHIGAQAISATGFQNFTVVGAPITINPGLIFFASTGNATTATYFIDNTVNTGFVYSSSTAFGSSASGVLPASITPPAKSVTTNPNPYFVLS